MFRNLIPALADKLPRRCPGLPRLRQQFGARGQGIRLHIRQLGGRHGEVHRAGRTEEVLHLPDGLRCSGRITGSPSNTQSVCNRLIVQNGNAYDEGLDNDFWKPIKAYWKDRTDAQGDGLLSLFDPGCDQMAVHPWGPQRRSDQPRHLGACPAAAGPPGNQEIQLALFYSYGSNPSLYPQWQEYFRKHQPPTLIVWGQNDTIFPAAGAHPYKRDLKNLEFHLLDTGHFALEEDGAAIATLMRNFLDKQVKQ